jgi:hypothetical protein
MIRREARRIVNEVQASSSRKVDFVKNYAFGGGGSGTGGFGGGGAGTVVDKTSGYVYTANAPGELVRQSRSDIRAYQGTYLQDNPAQDAINIVSDVINDPIWWLGV